MLTEYFGVTIKVRPFTGRWLALDETQRTVLGRSGRNNDLNGGAVIGSRVWDEQGHFTLEVGPIGFSRFADFLPAGRSYHRAVALTKFYVGQEFEFDVKLVLAAPHVPRARIARTTGAYLGWTSWLRSGGSADTPGVVVLQSDYRPVGAG
jgi:type VI secretion system protein ImpH